MKIKIEQEPCGQRDSKFSRLHVRFDYGGKRHVVTSSIFHDTQPPQSIAENLRAVANLIDAVVK